MKHCHMNLLCNELPFLKQKLPFLFKNFDQIIMCDYDIVNRKYSEDGSIEFIEKFKEENDIDNKITLIKDFNPDDVKDFCGISYIEKRKMFAVMSRYINDDMDLVWATDLDEFFEEELIKRIENKYESSPDIVSIDIPHLVFVYNQYNIFNFKELYIAPRITKYIKGRLYGHCNFETYGKTIRMPDEKWYHFAYIGFNRCAHKIKLYKCSPLWTEKFKNFYESSNFYIEIEHPGTVGVKSVPYVDGYYPKYIDVKSMVRELVLPYSIPEQEEIINNCIDNEKVNIDL